MSSPMHKAPVGSAQNAMQQQAGSSMGMQQHGFMPALAAMDSSAPLTSPGKMGNNYNTCGMLQQQGGLGGTGDSSAWQGGQQWGGSGGSMGSFWAPQ
eukprot:scaffold97065_cov13-Tisochrysis_lutea.AAC.1